MDVRPLGSTTPPLLVSRLGLGTVKLGRNRGLKHPGAEGVPLPTDDEATELLRTAAELGINLLDTAPAYGSSESRLGELLSKNDWFGGRERWVLCTKAGEEFDNETGRSRFDFSPAHIRLSVERSLQRLRTDHLEVILLHSDGRDDWILERSGGREALQALQREGMIRAWGLSAKTTEGALRAIALGADVVMVTYNQAEPDCLSAIDAAERAGVGVLIKKALVSGHAQDAAEALRFAGAPLGVSSIVVGTSSPAHLRANAGAILH